MEYLIIDVSAPPHSSCTGCPSGALEVWTAGWWPFTGKAMSLELQPLSRVLPGHVCGVIEPSVFWDIHGFKDYFFLFWVSISSKTTQGLNFSILKCRGPCLWPSSLWKAASIGCLGLSPEGISADLPHTLALVGAAYWPACIDTTLARARLW